MKSIGARIGIGWIVIGLLLMIGVGGAVLAQRGQGGPGGPPMGPPIIMKASPQGVFLLTGNTLTKYDEALAIQKTITLDGQSNSSDSQRPQRPRPAMMLLNGAGDKVLVLMGDEFFSIDAASLTVIAKATLPALPAVGPPPADGGNPPDGGGQMGPGGPGRPQMGQPMPGGLELQGNVLYMLRGPQIIGINITNGTLVGPVSLPKPADQSAGN